MQKLKWGVSKFSASFGKFQLSVDRTSDGWAWSVACDGDIQAQGISQSDFQEAQISAEEALEKFIGG